jgi:hypothetical protein
MEEKLDVISWLEWSERIADVCCNVRLAHSTICAICDIDDEIIESALSGIKTFV